MSRIFAAICMLFIVTSFLPKQGNAKEIVKVDSTGFTLNGVLFGVKRDDSSRFEVNKFSRALKGKYKKTKYYSTIELRKGGNATKWSAGEFFYSSPGFITHNLYHRFRKEYSVEVVVHGFMIDSNTTYDDIAKADIIKYSEKNKLIHRYDDNEVNSIYIENISNTGINILINFSFYTKKVFCIEVEF